MGAVTTSTKVMPSPDVLFQELHGEAVLLDMKTGVYFGLDRVGTRIWQLLGEQQLISGVVAGIMQEFEVSEAQCTSDVLELVERMQENGLIALE